MVCSGASSEPVPWKDHSGDRLGHVLKRICRVVLVLHGRVHLVGGCDSEGSWPTDRENVHYPMGLWSETVYQHFGNLLVRCRSLLPRGRLEAATKGGRPSVACRDNDHHDGEYTTTYNVTHGKVSVHCCQVPNRGIVRLLTTSGDLLNVKAACCALWAVLPMKKV